MSAPPGYNAGESLLQGGTADITPVMGGGGFIETNSDQSLLQGGEANIVPLKGGSRRRGYPTIAHVVTSLPRMRGGARTPIEVKRGTLDALADVPDIPKDKGVLAKVLNNYKNTMLTQWKRYMLTKIDNSLAVIPTFGKIKEIDGDDVTGQAGFDRLGIILPKSTESIVVLPPVNGDLNVYAQCVAYIRTHLTNQSIVILFSPRMYGEDAEINRQILYNFIELKRNSQASIYTITHNTVKNRTIGKRLGTENEPNSPLLNLIEPTYVVYPYPRLINGKMAGGILFSGAAEGEVDIPISTSPNRIGSISYAVKNTKSSIAFPPNTKKQDSFNNINPYTIFRLLDATEINQSPYEIILDKENIIKVDISGEKFVSTPDAQLFLDGVLYKEIDQGGEHYLLRRPTMDVTEDWRALKFTPGEASLLTDMKLRPDMMPNIFGQGWKDILANFLANMLNSNCFIDGTLLTTPECEQSQDFIQKVFQYYLEHDDRISMLEKAEAAADKKQIQMAKSILDADRADIKAEREEIKKTLDAELQKIKDHGEREGLDLSIDSEALQKDPFKDGKLKYIPSDALLRLKLKDDIYSHIDTPNKISKDLIVLHKKSKQYARASITIDGRLDMDGDTLKIGNEIRRLIKDYPGWLFITELLPSAAPLPAAPPANP